MKIVVGLMLGWLCCPALSFAQGNGTGIAANFDQISEILTQHGGPAVRISGTVNGSNGGVSLNGNLNEIQLQNCLKMAILAKSSGLKFSVMGGGNSDLKSGNNFVIEAESASCWIR